MALNTVQRLRHLGRAVVGRLITRLLANAGPGDTAARRALVLGRRSLSSVSGDASFLAGGSAGFHRESVLPPSEAEQRDFARRLAACSSQRQLLRLLRLHGDIPSNATATVLHRLADLEGEGVGSAPEREEARSLCLGLERDADRLTDGGLCALGRALLALEGPGGAALDRVMERLEGRGPEAWNAAELAAAYRLLREGAAEGGRRQALLDAMQARALPLASRMDAAAVGELMAALVALDQSHCTPLVIALCRQAVRHTGVFTDEQLSAVLGALMHFGHGDPHLAAAVERHAPRLAFTARPETVCRVARYFGHRNILSRPVFDALAESFVYRADEYDTGQVAMQIVPLGKLGYLPPNAAEVFGKVEDILHTRFSRFQPRTLLGLLHACTLVERFPVNFVSKVFKSFFLQQLQEQGTSMDRVVLAQLTQLQMTLKLECPFYGGPGLLPKYRVKSFLVPGGSLETPVDQQLYQQVRAGLVHLLGARTCFSSRVLTPYCYTLDVEIKLDEDGYVLPANQNDSVHKRVALCVDGQRRFTQGTTRQLLGTEATKQRHLRLLGYQVVQIPFHEFEDLKNQTKVVDYLHKKIFPHSYRLSW
ncbi:hypothetical protein NHX12_021085 [Muraenolepis orangiensis]|uniref:RAP domain-containing protein n=1 Tax=Muraenolepis orangiensis TaxID=630683 RepID=A0A9Q0EPM8_9TELE|nr:hypothetical protein NHX12_021085 [Muraenolepis orangiensis]